MKSYGQFCPVAKTAEILCKRWTLLIVRELVCGSESFNEIRRGVPLISPTLLAQRLRELEAAGIIMRRQRPAERGWAYQLTPSGEELRPLVLLAGSWGQRYLSDRVETVELDVGLLMWDMRRRLRVERLGSGRTVLSFHYRDAPRQRRDWWLLVDGQQADLCMEDPGFEPDVYVATDLKTMVDVWMGNISVVRACGSGAMRVSGRRALVDSMATWLGLSVFAVDSGTSPHARAD